MKLCRTIYCPDRPVPWMRERLLLAGKLNKAEARTRNGRNTESRKTDYYKLGSASFVSMVQAAHLRNGNDTAVLLAGPRLWALAHLWPMLNACASARNNENSGA